MAQSKLDLLIQVIDKYTQPLNKLASGIEQAEQAMQGLVKISEQFLQAGTKIAAIGGAVVAGFAATQVVAGSLEKSLDRVAALSNATSSEFEGLSETAKSAGLDMQYTATDAADALQFLSMAGFTATQSTQALGNVLNLASAANVDLAASADISSNILTGYGFKVADLARVNDVLVKTLTTANVDLSQLGLSIKYVGPIASAAGVSFEEAASAIALLGNAGIQGSSGGTGLRRVLASLLDPSKEAAAGLEQLGITVTDASGNFVGIADVLSQFETGLQKIQGDADKAAILMQIFGQQGGPIVAALLSSGSAALTEFTEKLENSAGTADRIAEQQFDNLYGAVVNLKSAFEGLLIEIGEPFLAVSKNIILFFSEIVKSVISLHKTMGIFADILVGLGTIFGGFLVVLGGGLVTIGAAGLAVKGLVTGFTTLVAVVPKLITGFTALQTAIKSSTALTLSLAAIWQTALVTAAAFSVLKIIDLVKGIQELNEVQQKNRDLYNELTDTAQKYAYAADLEIKSKEELLKLTDEEKEQYKKTLKEKIAYIGQSKAAALSISEEVNWLGLSTDAAVEAQESIADLTEEQKNLREGIDAVIAAQQAQTEAFKTPPDLSALKEQLDTTKKAQDGVTESIKEAYDARQIDIDSTLRGAAAEKASLENRKKYYTDLTESVLAFYNDSAFAINDYAEKLDDAVYSEAFYAETVKTGIEDIKKTRGLAAAEVVNEEGIVADKTIQLQREILEVKKQSAVDAKNFLSEALNESVAAEKAAAEKVKQLKESIVKAEENLQKQIQDIKLSKLSEAERLIEKEKLAKEALAASESALQEGSLEKAKEKAEEAKAYFTELAQSADKDSYDFKKFIEGVEEAGTAAIDALKAQEADAEEFWNTQKELTETFKIAVEAVNEQVQDFATQLSDLPESTVHEVLVDIIGAEAIEDLKQNTSSVHTVYIQEETVKHGGGLVGMGVPMRTFHTSSNLLPSEVMVKAKRNEYVLQESAVQKYGVSFLRALNEGNLAFNRKQTFLNFPPILKESQKINTIQSSQNFKNNLTLIINDSTYNIPTTKDILDQITNEQKRNKRVTLRYE